MEVESECDKGFEKWEKVCSAETLGKEIRRRNWNKVKHGRGISRERVRKP